MNALVHVLIGRDEAPAWRSATTRRTAYAAAALGWALLAASALAAVTPGARDNAGSHPQAHAGPAALGWLAIAFAVSAALPLTPAFPLLAWRIAYLGVLVTPLIGGQTRADAGYYVVLAIAFAVAGLRYGRRTLWWMAVLTLLPVWLWTGPDWVQVARLTIGLAVLAAALDGTGNWRRDRRALAAQTQQARQQRERNAVLEERARIAREMHDVVAHHMSMIAVQAETAPYRLAAQPGVPGLPEPAAQEFAAISAAAREALTEMRRLLGVLRSPDNSNNVGSGGGQGATGSGGGRYATGPGGGQDAAGAERAPQPRLEDVPELIDNARRAGARITLQMPDNSKKVPPGVGLTAYRIVQESLSNAGRHAPGAEISVVVEQEPPYVRIDVRNDPPATDQPRADGTGHGLAGMRERVALLGGQLQAGPEADGGFAVRAVLPTGDQAGDGAGGGAGGRAVSQR